MTLLLSGSFEDHWSFDSYSTVILRFVDRENEHFVQAQCMGRACLGLAEGCCVRVPIREGGNGGGKLQRVIGVRGKRHKFGFTYSSS